MTAIKLTEFNANVHGMPTIAIRMPAMPGPITRAILNIVLFSASALATADLSRTCSLTKACLVGECDSRNEPCESSNDEHLPVLRVTSKSHDSKYSSGQGKHGLGKQQDGALGGNDQ